jgi:hypothetical protein
MTSLRGVSSEEQVEPYPATTPTEDEEPRGVDLWIMPYLRDSALWPVLIVLIVHVVAFGTPILLYAVRDQRPGPIIGVAILVLLSLRGFVWEIRTRKTFGAISWLIVVSWISSFVAAYFANRHDFL